MAQFDYRTFVPRPGETRIAGATAEAHTAARLAAPRPQQLFAEWAALADEPFYGLTNDGLFALRPEGTPRGPTATHYKRCHPSPSWCCPTCRCFSER